MSVRYLNLVNARSRESHVECISLHVCLVLLDLTSALLRFAQVAYEQHC